MITIKENTITIEPDRPLDKEDSEQGRLALTVWDQYSMAGGRACIEAGEWDEAGDGKDDDFKTIFFSHDDLRDLHYAIGRQLEKLKEF